MKPISLYISTAFTCIVIVIVALIIFTPAPCDHEAVGTRYMFASYNESQRSSVNEYCKECRDRTTYYSTFEGTPKDTSYLNAIREHSDGSQILPGKYYTVTATAPLGYYGSLSEKLKLVCEVENDDFLVRFSAEFREEFMEQIELIEDGDTVTFRGRFYDEGCGFTDCELISVKKGT